MTAELNLRTAWAEDPDAPIEERQDRALRMLEIMGGLAVTAGLVGELAPGRRMTLVVSRADVEPSPPEEPQPVEPPPFPPPEWREVDVEPFLRIYDFIKGKGEAGITQKHAGEELAVGHRPLRRAITALAEAGRIEIVGMTRAQFIRAR